MKNVRYSSAARLPPAGASEALEIMVASVQQRGRTRRSRYEPRTYRFAFSRRIVRSLGRRLGAVGLELEEVRELSQGFGLCAHFLGCRGQLLRGRGVALGDLVHLAHRARHLLD